jgi:peroxiredoxin
MNLAILLEPSTTLDLAFGNKRWCLEDYPEVTPLSAFVPKNLAEMAVS